MLRELTPFLEKGLSKHEANLYRLGWVDLFDNDLGLTNSGRKAYIRCQVLFGGDFVKYATQEVLKRVEASKTE